MSDDTKNRLKSPVAWAATVALIVTLVFVLTGKDIKTEASLIFAGVSTALTAFGVWNNPTSKKF